MPQPDNRRERGAKTQTSQQTVAPQGQMPGTISPISGGAAAAAPVLQIGQQAQIKKTGAELYQAIAGVAQGVQQGIQNYDKMYNMVSEAEYAEFETAYIQQKDTVKGDPKKMKAWMDTQTYKPNRVTAKRYWSTRAEVNQRDYLDDQNDLWVEDLKRMANMSAAEKLNHMNEIYPTLDENSPYAMKMQETLLKTSGEVAAETRKLQMNALNLEWRSQNTELAATLLKTYPNVSGPNMEAVFAATRLGIVNVNGATGEITNIKSGEVVNPNSLSTEFVSELTNQIGQYEDPSMAFEAMRAAKLPVSMTGGGRKPAQDLGLLPTIIGEYSGVDANALRTLWGTVTGNAGDKNLKMLEQGLSGIGEIENPSTRMVHLRNFEQSLDVDPDSDLPNSFDNMFEDPAEARLVRREIMDDIRKMKTDTLIEKSHQSFVRRDGEKAFMLSQAEDRQGNANFLYELSQNAAEMGLEVSLVGIPAPVETSFGAFSVPPVAMSPEEFKDKDNLLPLQIVVHDPNIPSSVPFTFGTTPDGRITSGTTGGALRDLTAEQIVEEQERYRILGVVETMVRGGEGIADISAPDMGTAFDHLAGASPEKALGFLAGSPRHGSFKMSDGARDKVLSLVSPQALAENPDLRDVAGMAVAKFPSLLDGVTSDVQRTSLQYGGLAPDGLTPDGYAQWTRRAHALVEYHALTEVSSTADALLADFHSAKPSTIAALITEQAEDATTIEEQLAQDKQSIFYRGAEQAWAGKGYEGTLIEALQSEDVSISGSAKTFLIEYTTESSKIGSILALGGDLANGGSVLERISEGNMSLTLTPSASAVDTLSFAGGVTANEAAFTEVTEGIIAAMPEDKRDMYRTLFEENKEALTGRIKLIPIIRDQKRLVRVDGESSRSFEYKIDFSGWGELGEVEIDGETMDAQSLMTNLADSEFTRTFAPTLTGLDYQNKEAQEKHPTGNNVKTERERKEKIAKAKVQNSERNFRAEVDRAYLENGTIGEKGYTLIRGLLSSPEFDALLRPNNDTGFGGLTSSLKGRSASQGMSLDEMVPIVVEKMEERFRSSKTGSFVEDAYKAISGVLDRIAN